MNYRMLRLIMTAVAVLCPAFVFAQAPDGPLGVERVARFVPFGYGAAGLFQKAHEAVMEFDFRLLVQTLPVVPGALGHLDEVLDGLVASQGFFDRRGGSGSHAPLAFQDPGIIGHLSVALDYPGFDQVQEFP